MKIAFITFEYPPFIIGGAGVYAENIARELAKLGHQVVVFMPEINDSGRNPLDSINNLDIKKIKINKKVPFKALQFWLHLPKEIEKVEKQCDKFDVLHFNGLSYWFLKEKIIKAPHLATIHHLVKDAIRYNSSSLVSRIVNISGETSLFIPYIEKRCLHRVDKIIAVSDFTKKQIINNYKINPDKIEVVYNGVNLDEYSFTQEELKKNRKQFNLPEKPIVLFVGRVDDPRKDLDLLVKAFEKVLEKVDAILLVVGKGDQTQIRKLASALGILDDLIFTGFVDDVTLKKCYALCDVYVCPSRLEGFGLTVLEAMAAGKPIVATNRGAIQEVVRDAGVLVEAENPGALSEAIIEVLTDEQRRKILEQKALSRSQDFAWDVGAGKLLEIYKTLIT